MMVMVPSPLSVMTWSWLMDAKTWVKVPWVSRLVVTKVPRTLSR